MGTGKAVLDSFYTIQDRMTQVKLPILIMHGSRDRATCPSGSEQFFKSASSIDKTFFIYEEVEHIIFHERPDAVNDVIKWIDLRVGVDEAGASSLTSNFQSIKGERWQPNPKQNKK